MRSPFIALVRKDLKGYFDQPTGYVLVVIFVALLSYAFFRSVDLTREASLRELFTVTFTVERPSLPWLLVLFVPAATMRLLAEEQRDGTLEILLTQPIKVWVVLLAKFLSGFLFVSVAILATIGIPIALATAGNLDGGAIIGQYIGSLFLAAAFVSIGLFTSSLTQNQIVALIIGFTLTAVLMVVGLDRVIATLPTRLSGLLQTLSPITHFSTIARGVIDLRDVLYFVALVSTFLSAAFLMMRSKILSHRTSQYRNLQLGVVGLIVLSLLVGWFGNSIGGRLDLTEDKLFTLSEGTEQVLDSLDDILTVTLYQTKDPPPRIKLATRDINDFLDDLTASSGGRVKLVKKYPLEDEEALRKAALAGISRREFAEIGQTEASSKIGYLGMTVDYLNRRQVFAFIPTVDGFEYRVATSAYRMSQENKTSVTFLAGHGQRSLDQELQFFLSNLQQQYHVNQITAAEDTLPDFGNTDVLIVVRPTQPIPQKTRDQLSAYLKSGGKALFLLDPVIVLADQRMGLVALHNPNSFGDFVEQYGIVLEDNLVFDLRKNETVEVSDPQGGTVYRNYPYWLYAKSANQTVARNIESVLMGWPSEVAFSTGSRFETIPLIATSDSAAIDSVYQDISPGATVFQEVADENFVTAVLGAAVSGNADGPDEFRIVVIGDSDWLTDPMIQRSPNNLLLGLNLVDWLAEEELLAEVRNKIVSSRRLEFSSSVHENTVQYINIAAVPLGFIVVGLLMYLRRRSIGTQGYRHER